MTYLGYPNTTALKECDFRIVDSVTDPIGSESLCGETLLRIDPHFLCYEPLRPDRITSINPLPPSTRTGRVTFASFNATIKIVGSTIRAWADVLRAVPNSRLLLKSKHPGAGQRILRAFEAAGVDPARVEILPVVDAATDHLALYNDTDVALDSFPYNGTTTTYEALAMGVPVVALLGDRHAARVGASILTAVGLPQLIATTTDEYAALAATLARDTDRLTAWRRDLRSQLVASDNCNQNAFATRFARALHATWNQRVAAHSPA
jgi:predicted O-linked N-acetylglucosamine transferase (SPINDLY family)